MFLTFLPFDTAEILLITLAHLALHTTHSHESVLAEGYTP